MGGGGEVRGARHGFRPPPRQALDPPLSGLLQNLVSVVTIGSSLHPTQPGVISR